MNQYTILVVEDEPTIQSLCRRLLRQLGQEAVFTGTIAEALEKISGFGRLDLLIADIRLPDGDGGDVIAKAREKFPAAGVLVVTGSPTPDPRLDLLQKLNIQESDILFKPFEISRFEAEVRRRLCPNQ